MWFAAAGDKGNLCPYLSPKNFLKFYQIWRRKRAIALSKARRLRRRYLARLSYFFRRIENDNVVKRQTNRIKNLPTAPNEWRDGEVG